MSTIANPVDLMRIKWRGHLVDQQYNLSFEKEKAVIIIVCNNAQRLYVRSFELIFMAYYKRL